MNVLSLRQVIHYLLLLSPEPLPSFYQFCVSVCVRDRETDGERQTETETEIQVCEKSEYYSKLLNSFVCLFNNSSTTGRTDFSFQTVFSSLVYSVKRDLQCIR